MGLRDKHMTAQVAVDEGVWVDFPQDPNKDGSIPGFKLTYAGKANKKYTIAMRDWTKTLTNSRGVVDFDSLSEEEAEKYLLNIFADTILLEWRNFQPDEDKNMLFTRENVIKVFGSLDWNSLYTLLNEKSKEIALFKAEKRKAEAKN